MRTRRPGVSFRQILTTFWPFTGSRRGWLALSLGLALLPPLIETVEIFLFKVIVDDVLIPRKIGLLPGVAALYLALTLLTSAVSGARRMLSTWLSQRFLVDLREHLLRHLQRLSPDFFQRSRIGDLLARVSGDVAAIETFLLSAMAGFVTTALQLLFFLGAIFYLQWKLALLSVVVTPLFWFLARLFSARVKTLSREKQRLSGAISSSVEQTLSNIALVQAYDQQERQTRRFRAVLEEKYRVEMSTARLKSLFSPLVELSELLGVLAVIAYGALLVTRGELSVGSLLAFLTFLTSLYGPVRSLGGLANAAYAASAGAERVIEVLDERPLVQDRLGARSVDRATRLELRGVGFRYSTATRPALEDVSLSISPGQTVAVVGASGAGKSTLAKLLVRFYDPDAGAVLLDGHDLRDLELASLRRNVTVLLQETLVFDGTVRENIAYGRADADDEAVVRAARAADAHEFVLALPDGYDTQVGERGRRLSGGQAQRVAIARAMLRDSPFLLLDEPTTGLDADSADHVLEPLRRLMSGRATVIISHNLATVREATEIVVLDQGRVAERGTHDQLLRLGGRYAHLWRTSGLDRTPVRQPVWPEVPTRPTARAASGPTGRRALEADDGRLQPPRRLAVPRRARHDDDEQIPLSGGSRG